MNKNISCFSLSCFKKEIHLGIIIAKRSHFSSSIEIKVPPEGIEPSSQPPEGCTLSVKLWGLSAQQ